MKRFTDEFTDEELIALLKYCLTESEADEEVGLNHPSFEKLYDFAVEVATGVPQIDENLKDTLRRHLRECSQCMENFSRFQQRVKDRIERARDKRLVSRDN